jgi:hypothetical protein
MADGKLSLVIGVRVSSSSGLMLVAAEEEHLVADERAAECQPGLGLMQGCNRTGQPCPVTFSPSIW